jgi:hypothetical protein
MKTRAPELKALIIILRSTGPVISTRRSSRPGDAGAHRPGSRANAFRLGKKVQPFPALQSRAAVGAARKQCEPSLIELPLQPRNECDGVRGEHTVVTGCDGAADRDAVDGRLSHAWIPYPMAVGRSLTRAPIVRIGKS